MISDFYRRFEDRHRGSRELIKQRLRAYEPFIRCLTELYPEASAIDIGCGRGEWLEILREHRLRAVGVDLDAGMLHACEEIGLDVVQGDGLAYLENLPADSQAIVSAFHVVEHITFDQVRDLVVNALRVLKVGGVLIIETPNPENIVVGACNFYMDPTHQRPIPPPLLSSVAEFAGFDRVKTLRLQEARDLRESGIISLIDVLGGASPDYAIVAQKLADQETSARFDRAFGREYGLTLEELARRYDRSREESALDLQRQLVTAESCAKQAETRAIQAEAYAQTAESRAVQAEAHAQKAEARAAQAEAHAQQAGSRADQAVASVQRAEIASLRAESQLQAVYASRSWRLTAPIRFVGRIVGRGKNAESDES